MELSPKQQFIDLVTKSKSPLLLTHQRPDGDALGSILALQMVLKDMGKQVSAICVDPVPQAFKFLPETEAISQEFTGTRDFIISVDASTIKPDKIFYKIENNKLNIVITPKSGQFKPDMVCTTDGGFKYDLIIVLDSTEPERLGISFESNPDLFFETPVINIDHHPGNDYFGTVNLVDLTATSTSEILVSLIEALGQKFNENTATALLTGIITDTGSFQNANTTPKSLTIAAQLVAAGARQQEIIKSIYKTRSLTTLKLWGLVLSNMKLESEGRFIWSAISIANFEQVGAGEDESAGVIDELLKTAADVDFALLMTERNGGIHGSLRSVAKGIDVSSIASAFGGGGHVAAAAFQVEDTTLADGTSDVIEKIKGLMGKTVVDHYEKNNQIIREKLHIPSEVKPEEPILPEEEETSAPDGLEQFSNSQEESTEESAPKVLEVPADIDESIEEEEPVPKW